MDQFIDYIPQQTARVLASALLALDEIIGFDTPWSKEKAARVSELPAERVNDALSVGRTALALVLRHPTEKAR